MKIGIYSKSVQDKKHAEAFNEVIQQLHAHKHTIFSTHALVDFYHINYSHEIPITEFTFCDINNILFDVLICVGGDGTILDAVTLVRDSNIPVIGINTGRLGFLTGVQINQIEEVILCIEKNNYTLESRTLIHLQTSEKLFDFPFALNDFVIHKKETSSMIVVGTYLNGEFLNSYWADGLIVSTPTGSTGYSLSCGGPIIFPKSDNFIITPIAPHNLNVRPVVVNDNHVLSFEIEGRANSYLISLDARSASIDSNIQIALQKANFELQLMRLPKESYMDTLRNKLNWGIDKRN